MARTCNLGRRDPECKGMGSGKGGGKESGKGKSTGKSEGGKGKSKGEKGQPKGGKAGKTTGEKPAPQSLPDDAIKDSKGRYLCYDYVHGRCNKGDACKRYHGPETPAMHKKRVADEKKIANRQGATQSDTEDGADNAKAKAKAKAAAKGAGG